MDNHEQIRTNYEYKTAYNALSNENKDAILKLIQIPTRSFSTLSKIYDLVVEMYNQNLNIKIPETEEELSALHFILCE